MNFLIKSYKQIPKDELKESTPTDELKELTLKDESADDFTFTDSESSNEDVITDIYVLCENSLPITYCTSEIEAKKQLNILAWDCKKKNIQNNMDYMYYLTMENHTSIGLYESYKNWLISYDTLVAKFSYVKISQNENLNR